MGKFYPDDSEGYIIARGIYCPNCEGQIPLLHEAEITASAYLNLRFDQSTKKFEAYITKREERLPYQGKKKGEIVCPYCGKHIAKRHAYKLWTKNHTTILKELEEGHFDKNRILSTHVLLV